jgi:hypothetical protein
MAQPDEHPSPLRLFPSSHFSELASFPSPQVDVQLDQEMFTDMQMYPYSCLQVLEHPSELIRLPSSHSPEMMIESPQMGVQILGVVRVALVHVYPLNAAVQSCQQPSLLGLPVSHQSVVTLIPSPQMGD